MIKTSLYSLSIFLMLFLFSGCKKDLESIVDCLGESVSFKFDHSISSSNAKEATLTVMYSGSFSLQNTVEWDFGDGKKLTTSSTTTTHTYANPGNYTAKAFVTIKKGGETCNLELTESIVIN
ncbi:MAG: PKD domain-containing protein [Cytophagales bacterium]|nr:MAG: PKD domain-containing protein [Cytophagales bacterium]